MRVAIDARGVQPRLQGVGRHVVNLLLGLSSRESDLEFLVFYNNPLARKLVEKSGGSNRRRFQWVKVMAQPGKLLENVEIPWLLKINKADLFHDVGGLGVLTGNVPSILTIHELATPKNLKRAIRNSRLVIAVSQSLATEIEDTFNVSRPKIRVISNAVSPKYTERVSEHEVKAMRERFRLPETYYLCVTADRPNKNVDFVRRVATQWPNKNESWVFTVEGKDTESVRYFDVLEDVWLRPLYAGAQALVVPSLYEGFSLPPIEALSIGTVPVVSDIGPHHELLDETLASDLFFDPKSESSLTRALRRVTEGGEPLRLSVLEKFRLVRDRYSFIETAQSVQTVYREAFIN